MQTKELLWRIPLAIFGGLIAALTFPTENVWLLTPLIPAVITLAVLGAGFWMATLIAFHAGVAFYLSHIEWISQYLGPIPLFALTFSQVLSFAPAFGLVALIWLRLRGSVGRRMLFVVLAAQIWTAREWIANNFPYGGFPWSRLAMTQSETWLANWVYLGGLSLLSFVLALTGTALAVLIHGWRGRDRNPLILFAVSATAVTALVPLVLPVGNTTAEGTMTIAAIQGNANAGIFANPDRGSILQNHLDATELALTHPRASEIELIVWPENASDLDPLRSDEARAKIEELVNRTGVPLTFGTLTNRGGQTYNTTLLWLPEVGPVDYYDKKRPVPFAEYVPDRAFWRLFAPDLIDLVTRDFGFGVREGIFEVDGVPAGTLICFEIAIDDIGRDLVAEGAQLILSQTNNADFGYSDETYQQVAIAQLRAIETGRSVVNISTVGKSAIFAPDGSVLDSLEWYQPGAMVTTVELRSGLTPAMILGGLPDLVNMLLVAGMAFWVAARGSRGGITAGRSRKASKRR
jgi:apolipoprotein N-acyltransferase